MRYARRRPAMTVAAAGLVAAATVIATSAGSAPALGSTASQATPANAATAARQATAAAAGPRIKLIAAQHDITAPRFGKQVFLDPGIWVAALGSPLRLNVERSSYTRPLQVTQVIRARHGAIRTRRLPHWVLDGWNGLRRFARLTVRNQHGKLVASTMITFCPDSYSPARTGPNSALTSPFPQACSAGDPFPLATAWGIAKGWAVDPAQFGGNAFRLRLGRYTVTENITTAYLRLFRIAARDAKATVSLRVVKSTGCCSPFGCCSPGAGRPGQHGAPASKPLPSLPRVPLLQRVPRNALPDLVPLPSWGITTSHVKNTGRDYLNFGATVWVGGNSPLDVEGFRKAGSPIMNAYQYFWRNGRIVGRVRAGTMGFDNKKGHNHWHFEQFARYQLMNASKKLAVRSQKVGFCIAPTDAVNLLLPHAVWQPSSVGLGGQCGSPTALWVQELMPTGWGDTYNQFKAGQAFDITSLPNGTYYVEIIANPGHILREVTTSNDTSLRKVIISGTPGHRQVRVPAWHGIDPEN